MTEEENDEILKEEHDRLQLESKLHQTKQLTILIFGFGALLLCLYHLNPPELNKGHWEAKDYLLYLSLVYILEFIAIWR